MCPRRLGLGETLDLSSARRVVPHQFNRDCNNTAIPPTMIRVSDEHPGEIRWGTIPQ